MPRIVCLAAGFLLAAASAVDAGSGGGISWITDYDEGMSLARQTHRPVMLDFWAGWCRPCLQMDEDVYTAPALIEAARGFVFIRLDFDRTRRLVEQFRVRAVPTMVFIDPSGRVLANHVGYVSAQRLLETMQLLPASFASVADSIQALERNPRDVTALSELGEFYRGQGLIHAAKSLYKEAARAQGNAPGPGRDRVQLMLALLSMATGEQKEAEKILRKGLEGCGPDSRPLMLLGLTRIYVQRGRLRDAQGTLDQLLRDYPGTVATAKAQEVVATRQWDR